MAALAPEAVDAALILGLINAPVSATRVGIAAGLALLAVVAGACGDDNAALPDGAPIDAPPAVDAMPALMTVDDWCPGRPHCAGAGDGKLYVGAAKASFTPDLADAETEWTDVNGDHEWDSSEPFVDRNGNGAFDAYWLAGYDNGVPVKGFHDDLEARAMAFRWNDVTVAIAYIDAVGLFIDDIERIQEDPQLADLELDHVIIGSTHLHDGIDTIGLWGPAELITGVDPDQQAYLRSQTAKAIREAVLAMAPARLKVARTLTIDPPGDPTGSTLHYVGDIRDPIIYDPWMTLLQFTRESDGATIGTLVNWASHVQWIDPPANPENLASADLVYWLRKGLEEGVPETMAGAAATGVGGVTVFVQGPQGGQIGTEKVDPIGADGQAMVEEGFPAAEAVGTNAARLGLEALADAVEAVGELPISYRTAELYARVDNVFYHVLILTGLGDRQMYFYDPSAAIDENNIPYVRSRSTYLQIGPVATITAPGELCPELWVGGYDGSWSWGEAILEETVNAPDLAQAPAGPYLRDLMLANPGVEYAFVAGLAEDFLGYVVARFNFVLDETSPYTEEAEGDHYEETNSIGPYAEEQLNHPMLELARWRPPAD